MYVLMSCLGAQISRSGNSLWTTMTTTTKTMIEPIILPRVHAQGVMTEHPLHKWGDNLIACTAYYQLAAA